MSAAEEGLAALEAWLSSHASVVVCLSGGVDSAVLAAAAARALGGRAAAATGISWSLADVERAGARALCAALGLVHIEVETRELEREGYRQNPVDRCYHCKTELFLRVREALPADRSGSVLLEGTHADDLRGHRPGHRAAHEHGVRSPFVELGWGKAEVRSAARALALPVDLQEKPSSPCLASRLPFGTPVTTARLSMVERAEAVLRARGYRSCRVRHHGDVARIELPRAELARFVDDDGPAVAAALRTIGFVYTSLDVLGLRSGSLHEALRILPDDLLQRAPVHTGLDGAP